MIIPKHLDFIITQPTTTQIPLEHMQVFANVFCRFFKLPKVQIVVKEKTIEDYYGSYENKNNLITVIRHITGVGDIYALCHELRHHWQRYHFPLVYNWWMSHYSLYCKCLENASIELDAHFYGLRCIHDLDLWKYHKGHPVLLYEENVLKKNDQK